MRHLTIKRTKRFTACLVTLKVYIEDQTSNELVINNTPCRYIGNLKNGEEKTFGIDGQARKVYVIADVASRNYCNDFYQLPEGEEDIYLTGECKGGFGSTNSFQFDGNESNEEVMANRKRNKKKGVIIICIAIAVGILIGILPSLLSIGSNKPKTFDVNDSMSITLTGAFDEMEIEGFDAVYFTEDVSLFIFKDLFSVLPGLEDYTVKEYSDLFLDMNSLSGEMKSKDGLSYVEYESDDIDGEYCYAAFFFKTDDAFWVVQFATDADDYGSYTERIIEWAASVEFN